MSNEGEFQKWCEMLVPVVEAASLGSDIEWLDHNGVWLPKGKTTGFVVDGKYRIKPRTIMIGDIEVPEPMREAPAESSNVFAVDISCCGPDINLVIGSNYREKYHRQMLDRGLLHSSRESAIAHAKALIALTAKK